MMEFNQKRGESSYRKLRKIVSNNLTGDVIGITLSKEAATTFSGTYFHEEIHNSMIILTSGCPPWMRTKVKS